jgi:hypothetical protein
MRQKLKNHTIHHNLKIKYQMFIEHLLAILSLKSNFSKKLLVNIAYRTAALAAINQWQKNERHWHSKCL